MIRVPYLATDYYDFYNPLRLKFNPFFLNIMMPEQHAGY